MKEKTKGFTLIELLAVIVILAIIMVIATMQVNKQIKKAKKNANEINKKQIEKAVKTCLVENSEEECDTIEELQKNGYLDDFEDPWDKDNKELDSSYAIIINEDKTSAKAIYQPDSTSEEKEEIQKAREITLLENIYKIIEKSKTLIENSNYNTYNLRNVIKYNSNDYEIYVTQIVRDNSDKVVDRIPSGITENSPGLTEGILVLEVSSDKSIYRSLDFNQINMPTNFYKFQDKNSSRICVVLDNNGKLVNKNDNPDYGWCQIIRFK